MGKIEMKRRPLIAVGAFFVVLLMAVALTAVTVSAAGNVTVKVQGTYGQTEARSMLSMINDFRTGRYIDGDQSAVWARSSSEDIDTASYTNLDELQYDYELEKVAMQRAMEIAVSWSHTRPNNSDCSSLIPDGYFATGENIATGYGEGSNQTAKQAFDSWCETNDPYSGQGHRRNMLGRNYNRVGIAHVVIHFKGRLTEGTRPYNYETDIHYWVQIFGKRNDSFGFTQTSANDTSTIRDVEIDSSKQIDVIMDSTVDSIEVEYGGEGDIEGIKEKIRINGKTWPIKFNLSWSDGATSVGTYYLAIESEFDLSSNNSNIAAIAGNKVKGQKVGETKITATSRFDSTKSKSINVTVTPASISDATVTWNEDSYEYTGENLTPEPTVKKNGTTLVKDVDYELAYSKNKNVGNAEVTITGKGNYQNSIKTGFTIVRKTLTSDMVTLSADSTTYNGGVQIPSVTVKDGTKTLVAGTDYNVSITEEPIAAKQYEITITGTGNYQGEIKKTFTINKKALTSGMISLNKESFEYTGTNQKPEVSVDGGKAVAGTDYMLSNDGGTDVGEYSVTVTAKDGGNYTGSAQKTFAITPKSLTADMITINDDPFTYDGEKQKPENITVKNGELTLEEGTDYEITSNEGGIEAGNYSLTISAIDGGNYSGSVEKSFTIGQKEIDSDMIRLDADSFEFDGTTKKPEVTVTDNSASITEGDYEIVNNGGTNAGDYSVTVNGKGNYKGSASKSFTITSADINNAQIENFSGEIQQGDSVTATLKYGDYDLISGVDYTISPEKPGVGTQEVKIIGKGNFHGEVIKTVTVTEKPSGTDSGGGSTSGNTNTNDPNQKGSDGTSYGTGASAAVAERAITSMKSDSDPKGTVFGKLQLKSGKIANTAITLSWKKPSGTVKFVLYGNQCGKNNTMKKIKQLTGKSFKVTTAAGKKLKKGTYYKFMLVAIDKNDKVVSTSKIIHVATNGGKVGNHKSLVVKAKVGKKLKAVKSVSVKVKKTLKLKVTANAASKKLKAKKHVVPRFESSNAKIATVSKAGVIKGIKKGKCVIYVYAQNGVSKSVKVTVK